MLLLSDDQLSDASLCFFQKYALFGSYAMSSATFCSRRTWSEKDESCRLLCWSTSRGMRRDGSDPGPVWSFGGGLALYLFAYSLR